MKFKTSLLKYTGKDDWVEPALFSIRELLDSDTCPDHGEGCEHGRFLIEASNALGC